MTAEKNSEAYPTTEEIADATTKAKDISIEEARNLGVMGDNIKRINRTFELALEGTNMQNFDVSKLSEGDLEHLSDRLEDLILRRDSEKLKEYSQIEYNNAVVDSRVGILNFLDKHSDGGGKFNASVAEENSKKTLQIDGKEPDYQLMSGILSQIKSEKAREKE